MEKVFKDSTLEQLFEISEQSVYDKNEDIKQIGADIVDIQTEIKNHIKDNIEEKSKAERTEQLLEKLEDIYSKEIEFWKFEYFKLGFAEAFNLKEEVIKYKNNSSTVEKDEKINMLINDNFDDILDMIENEKRKRLSNTEKYISMRKTSEEIAKKYPKAVEVFEDRVAMELTKEETNAVIELIRKDSDESIDETKLAFRLGVKIGANL